MWMMDCERWVVCAGSIVAFNPINFPDLTTHTLWLYGNRYIYSIEFLFLFFWGK